MGRYRSKVEKRHENKEKKPQHYINVDIIDDYNINERQNGKLKPKNGGRTSDGGQCNRKLHSVMESNTAIATQDKTN